MGYESNPFWKEMNGYDASRVGRLRGGQYLREAPPTPGQAKHGRRQ